MVTPSTDRFVRRFLLGLCIPAMSMVLLGENQPEIRNAGFEDAQQLSVWKQWVYADGKSPVIRVDDQAYREGRHALLVQAEEPADIALGQVVTLPPGSVWRARCWIKTENLQARDHTDTTAALHIQTPTGVTVARGPSTTGTTDWHETSVAFRVPADGQVKLTLFFVGFGKGTGKVWFDDMGVKSLSPAGRGTIRITGERLASRPIDIKQGGQFIEPLCNLIPSLLAQQVANTSFEEDPPWKVAFRRDVDKPYRPWYPDGAVHLAKYLHDTNQPFNGKRSLRIELPVTHTRAGISQDGYYLTKGQRYHLRLHVRGLGNVAVRTTLHGDGSLAAPPVSLGPVEDEWSLAEAVFHANRTLNQATLTIDFEGAGTLWLDRVSLLGEDAVLGLWRPDAVAAIRALHPGVIRFGGSALETYEWDQCIGHPDLRAPFHQTYWEGLKRISWEWRNSWFFVRNSEWSPSCA